MEIVEFKSDGRLYKAYKQGEEHLIIGPPEGLVDELGLPEPFATRLHNILYRRNLFGYADVVKNRNSLLGALQEALSLDEQSLAEQFYVYEKETRDE